MKLITFTTNQASERRPGMIRDGRAVDLSGVAPDMLSALRLSPDTLRAAADTAPTIDLADVELDAPVRPQKVLAIAMNYAAHVEEHLAESGLDTPEYQVWFNKQHNCINAPYGDINLPAVSAELDYEAELCVVIGKRCKHVPRSRAHEVIAGYCCGNDVSVRDWQLRTNPQTMQIGKSFDTHGPIGPWIVTPDEVGDPHSLDIECFVNGERRQSSNTRHLLFDCYDAIAHLSQAFTLDVGDVLFTGTPAGVGAAADPPNYLEAGDVVRVEIEKLGHIENRVVAEKAECIIEA
jgi:2-keto-4-pentenoate hydratase/2-oxohepta-3-ene-1,7-dioic acid hydratase in catechol pathway